MIRRPLLTRLACVALLVSSCGYDNEPVSAPTTDSASPSSSTTSGAQPPTTTATDTPTKPTIPPATWPTPTVSSRPGVPAGGLPDPRRVKQSDATAVAVAAAVTMHTYDTMIDTKSHDAVRRALTWCTPALARQLGQQPQREGLGSKWTTWHTHRAYTRARGQNATEYGAPPDTATLADRTIAVTMTPIGRDRWRGTAETAALYVTLTRAGATAPWRISRLSVQ